MGKRNGIEEMELKQQNKIKVEVWTQWDEKNKTGIFIGLILETVRNGEYKRILAHSYLSDEFAFFLFVTVLANSN